MAERTGLLNVEPFLQTASVEEMTAGGDDRRVHVLENKTTPGLESTHNYGPPALPLKTDF